MPTHTKTTGDVPRPVERPVEPVQVPVQVQVQPDLQMPEPQPNQIPPAPAANPSGGALMPAFLLMVFASCFIINPLGTGSAAKDEVLLAFCVFWFGALSLVFRPFLVARFPSVANAPAYIVQFIHNCIFPWAPEPGPVNNY